MAYLPLNNYLYDSGPHRIQSGPNHEGYIVLTSGVQSVGADNGIIVDGTPLSGITGSNQNWAYNANWRYSPVFETDASVSGAYNNYYSSYTTTSNSKVQTNLISNSLNSLPSVNPVDLNLTKGRYIPSAYFGGAAPDNQFYSPFYTPETNTASEGITGGGVTHRIYENPLLINVLGSQGTSNRSEWDYSKPVYCQTYTETIRSTQPGSMSSAVRSIYRGQSAGYITNYGLLLGGTGGEFTGCPIPAGCPTTTGSTTDPHPGDVLTVSVSCEYLQIRWFNTLAPEVPLGEGPTYTIQTSDNFSQLFYEVTYRDGTKDYSNSACLGTVSPLRNYDAWALLQYPFGTFFSDTRTVLVNDYGETFMVYFETPGAQYYTLVVQKFSIDGEEIYSRKYPYKDFAIEPYYQTIPGRTVVATLGDSQTAIFVSSQVRAFEESPGYAPYIDLLQIFRIVADTGEIYWRAWMNPNIAEINQRQVTSIQAVDSMNRVWVGVTVYNVLYLYGFQYLDPAEVFFRTLSYTGAATVPDYPDSFTILRKPDGSYFLIWDDNSNRHVIFDSPGDLVSFSAPVTRVPGLTSLKYFSKPICNFVQVNTNSGLPNYVGAQGYGTYADRLILYDVNLNPLKTVAVLGYPKSLFVDFRDRSKVYVLTYAVPGTTLTACGITFRSGSNNNAFAGIFTLDNTLSRITACTVFTTTSGTNFIPPPEPETSDFAIVPIPEVNRIVITHSPYGPLGYDTEGQITGFFTVSMPVTASGGVANFPFPTTAGPFQPNPSGLIVSRTGLNVILASGVVPLSSGFTSLYTTNVYTAQSGIKEITDVVPLSGTRNGGILAENYTSINYS